MTTFDGFVPVRCPVLPSIHSSPCLCPSPLRTNLCRYRAQAFLPASLTSFTAARCHFKQDPRAAVDSPVGALFDALLAPATDFAVAGLIYADHGDPIPAVDACLLKVLAVALDQRWLHHMTPLPFVTLGMPSPPDPDPFPSRPPSDVIPTVDITEDDERIGARAAQLVRTQFYRPDFAAKFEPPPRPDVIPPRVSASPEERGRNSVRLEFEQEVDLQPVPGCDTCCNALPFDVWLESAADWSPAGGARVPQNRSQFVITAAQAPVKLRYSWAHVRQCRLVNPLTQWPAALFTITLQD